MTLKQMANKIRAYKGKEDSFVTDEKYQNLIASFKKVLEKEGIDHPLGFKYDYFLIVGYATKNGVSYNYPIADSAYGIADFAEEEKYNSLFESSVCYKDIVVMVIR